MVRGGPVVRSDSVPSGMSRKKSFLTNDKTGLGGQRPQRNKFSSGLNGYLFPWIGAVGRLPELVERVSCQLSDYTVYEDESKLVRSMKFGVEFRSEAASAYRDEVVKRVQKRVSQGFRVRVRTVLTQPLHTWLRHHDVPIDLRVL